MVHSNAACDGTDLSVDDVVIHHFKHGREGQLVNIAKTLSAKSELWIAGDDDALGMGAVGISACVTAESPEYTIHTLVFENHDICPDARVMIIHSLRQTPSLLEPHLKYTRSGEIFVRRLVYASPEVKAVTAPGILTDIGIGQVFPYFPPRIGPTETQISVDALGIGGLSEDQSLVAFVGKITYLGADVSDFSVGTSVSGRSSPRPPLHEC